jgi:hypothetical protein
MSTYFVFTRDKIHTFKPTVNNHTYKDISVVYYFDETVHNSVLFKPVSCLKKDSEILFWTVIAKDTQINFRSVDINSCETGGYLLPSAVDRNANASINKLFINRSMTESSVSAYSCILADKTIFYDKKCPQHRI